MEQEKDKLTLSFIMTARNGQSGELSLKAKEIDQLDGYQSVLNDALKEAIKGHGNYAEKLNTVSVLLELGADPSEPNYLLPVTQACAFSNKHVVMRLIEHGGKIQGEHSKEHPGPLITAVMDGKADIVDLLIRSKIKLTKGQEQFAAAVACCHDHVVILDMLLKAGAKLTYDKDPKNYPLATLHQPMTECVYSESMDCLRYLYDYGESVSANDAVMCGQLGSLKMTKCIIDKQGELIDSILLGASSTSYSCHLHIQGQYKIVEHIICERKHIPEKSVQDKMFRSLVLDSWSNDSILNLLAELKMGIAKDVHEDISNVLENLTQYESKEKRIRRRKLGLCNII